MPKHTTKSVWLKCTDCGFFWQPFWAPHSQLFAQPQMGGTKMKMLVQPSAQHSGPWRQLQPPAACIGLGWENKGALFRVRKDGENSPPMGTSSRGPEDPGLGGAVPGAFLQGCGFSRSQANHVDYHPCVFVPRPCLTTSCAPTPKLVLDCTRQSRQP